jgi:hypothetical protein
MVDDEQARGWTSGHPFARHGCNRVPVVVTGGVILEIWYYTPAAQKSRALYLDDPGGE